MDCSPQSPLSMGFPNLEYWSGQPFPSSGDLPKPEIEPRSTALQVDSLPAELPGEAHMCVDQFVCPSKPKEPISFIWNVSVSLFSSTYIVYTPKPATPSEFSCLRVTEWYTKRRIQHFHMKLLVSLSNVLKRVGAGAKEAALFSCSLQTWVGSFGACRRLQSHHLHRSLNLVIFSWDSRTMCSQLECTPGIN